MALGKTFRRHRRRRLVRRKKNRPNFIGKEEQRAEETEGTFFASSRKSTDGHYRFSQPGDPQELEADAMAEKVTCIQHDSPSVVAPTLGSEVANTPAIGTISLKCEDCKEEDGEIHKMAEEDVDKAEDEELAAKESEQEVATMSDEEVDKQEEEEYVASKGEGSGPSAAPPGFAHGLRNTKGKGSPLKTQTQKEMSAVFGYDFRNVRIHTDHRAEKLSKDIHAQAFTNGQDVYFNQDRFNPQSAQGKKLLAHELTHVVQQDKQRK